MIHDPAPASENTASPLSTRLRGIVPVDNLDSPMAYWPLADGVFAHLVATGADPDALVDAVRGCLTGGEAIPILIDATQPWNNGKRPVYYWGNQATEVSAYAAMIRAEHAAADPAADPRETLATIAAMLRKTLPSTPQFA